MPILSYGHPILREQCEPVTPQHQGVGLLIDNMWETMYNAQGCGLSASQVNVAWQIFIVDSKTTYQGLKPDERAYYFHEADTGIIETFINAKMVDQSVENWEDLEGCLSIPNLARPVSRPVTVTIEYQDRNFINQVKTFSGATARMVQHEFDHTRGILYLDYLAPLTRRLLENKLRKISAGLLPASYLMNYLK